MHRRAILFLVAWASCPCVAGPSWPCNCLLPTSGLPRELTARMAVPLLKHAITLTHGRLLKIQIYGFDVYVAELDLTALALQANPAGSVRGLRPLVLQHVVYIQGDNVPFADDIISIPLARRLLAARLFLWHADILLLDILPVLAVIGCNPRAVDQNELARIARLELRLDSPRPDLVQNPVRLASSASPP